MLTVNIGRDVNHQKPANLKYFNFEGDAWLARPLPPLIWRQLRQLSRDPLAKGHRDAVDPGRQTKLIAMQR